MLTFVAPLIIYLLSFPVMFVTLFRVEIGILFFISTIPIISLMKKIVEFPIGNQFADLILISIVAGWIFKNLMEGKRIFNNSPMNIAVILMIFGSIINLIRGYTFMDFPEETNLIRLMAWKNYMILPLVYFIAANNIKTEKFVKWVIICVSLTLLAMDLNFYSTFRWMRAEHYSDSIRISGAFSFLGPNELGVFYTVYTFLLLGISYYIEDKKLKYFLLFACACNFYPIMFSYSRAAYISTMVGFSVLGLLKDRKFLVLLILIVLFYGFILPRSVVERINMTFLGETQVSQEMEQRSAVEVVGVELDTVGRKQLWEKAQYYFKEEPLFGIGFDTFRHKEGMITHSMFMKILAEQGLIGIIIFIIFTGMVLRQSYKLFRNSSSKIGQGIGLGFIICEVVHLTGSLTGDQSLYYNLMSNYWLFLGIVASFNIHFSNDNKQPKRLKNES
jgi:O-antigen ligase